MIPTFRRLLALAVAAPLVMGACGPDDEVDDMEIDTPATEAPTTAPSAPMTVQLDPVGNSQLEGQASTMHRGDEVEISVALAGLTGEEDFTATIERGTCPMSSPAAPTGTEAEGAVGEGESGDDDRMDKEITEIDLNVSANSATGSATIDASEIAGGGHIAIRDQSDALVACGDIRTDAQGTTPGDEY